ncbi:hypothetical protein NHX12_000954 [Muraenolepis orangiensis]|uniref:Ig-like domain-containing protein n=1 Tax=Muraenolepis orangiensis TaxID=630683 RepID=A0A9Q0E003_9TELE|nr:hypothetical protein NHX12_000954 [Muraenolepis orangiensis]
MNSILQLKGLVIPGALQEWHVEYPKHFCVVEGSTARIPCSFTHPEFPKRVGAAHQVDRVVWCRNPQTCQRTTPAVYDSLAVRANSTSVYLGDHTGNCTLKINNFSQDERIATYRFRIETSVILDGIAWMYTGKPGVHITVTKAEVRVSSSENVVKEGGRVTLTCTANCSFHQLEVNWYRNGQALLEKGPALHLSDLTIHDTGNYTCSLATSTGKMSVPWSLVVEGSLTLIVALVVVCLAVFFLLFAGLVVARRRHAPKKASDVIVKQEVDSKPEVMGASEEVSYSAVHFKPKSSRSVRGQEDEIIYSEVSAPKLKH